MKIFFVKKSCLKGEISPPSSKSQTIRAILFASIADGKSKIKNFLKSDDVFAFIEGCKKFKAKIFFKKNNLEVIGVNKKIILKSNDKLDVKNSGLALRFLTSIYALSDKSIEITGDSSIRANRSMKPLIEALNYLGANVKSKNSNRCDRNRCDRNRRDRNRRDQNDFAPLEIKGPFSPGSVKIDAEDSQHLSSLLIACSLLKKGSIIEVKNSKERSWVEMTLNWLDKFNVKYENLNFEIFKISAPNKFKSFEYTVPTDFSSALFPITAALITNSRITLKDIVFDDFQKDQKTMEIFQKCGADIRIDKENRTIQVNKSSLKGDLTVDADDFIDSVPILAVFGCFNDGTLILKNAQMARKKESNRLFAITSELKKMNADIQETQDGLIIKKSDLKPAAANSHCDHRIAMSLCVAALATQGVSTIENINCIDKTYPAFKEDLKALGALIL